MILLKNQEFLSLKASNLSFIANKMFKIYIMLKNKDIYLKLIQINPIFNLTLNLYPSLI